MPKDGYYFILKFSSKCVRCYANLLLWRHCSAA